jgi:hypothetical protein
MLMADGKMLSAIRYDGGAGGGIEVNHNMY